MSTIPALAGAPAATHGTGAAERAAEGVAARVGRALEAVFEAVAETAAETEALLTRVAAEGRRPATADLAALRPGLHLRLARQELVSGVGFIAAPGLLADVPAWLEWWQSTGEGDLRPLLLDLDPGRSAYADYTHWDWFALPRDTGRRAVAGPYVDYLCSDEYSLTLSAPVEVAGRFAGVAAADVYLRHFETAVLPLLRELPGPAYLVNARGRVAASADPAHLAGSLTRGPGFAAVLERARPAARGAVRLVPCRHVPLVLVVDAGLGSTTSGAVASGAAAREEVARGQTASGEAASGEAASKK
ncbi:cache domain-containing protein [Streptomyces sp. NPDC006393]|uniref:cache domain-containing protein n=1 Tax=Streptomyces sp. NPDC006393 TaxID=3156763 RepID=UPI0033F7113F